MILLLTFWIKIREFFFTICSQMCFEQTIQIHALLEQRSCPYELINADAGKNWQVGSFKTQLLNCF